MTTSKNTVFLSYASEDSEAARRICAALQTRGIEVWFDQSDLRGGDVWDQRIRRQIKDCALFVPLVSANTLKRTEGYFRLEWHLADQRTHLMARNKVFIVPVAIDAVPDAAGDVPESFTAVQWMGLLDGEEPAAFVEHVRRLLSPDEHGARTPAPPAVSSACLIAQSTPSALSSIPEKSIAVLPFVDMSARKNQEYFSDGLAEALIDLLTQVQDLRVPARTSSFSFKGKSDDIATIAQKLRVAHVLEGSVRKAGHTIRITAHLIRADSGYHLWSKTYDRNLDDIFKVQDEIARMVAGALKVALVAGRASDERSKSNTEAYNLVLRGDYVTNRARSKDDIGMAIGYYNEAIALDPIYALAWAKLAAAYDRQAYIEAAPVGRNLAVTKAREAVQSALKIDPDLAYAHRTLGVFLFKLDWNWDAANAEFERARELDPSDVHLLANFARMATIFGRFDEAIGLYRQVISQDPLEIMAQYELSYALLVAGRLQESADSWRAMVEPAPGSEYLYAVTLSYLGRNDEALQEAQKETHEGLKLQALSIVNWTLGRRADSDAALKELTDRFSSALPTNIALVHACRGEIDAAFDWLERGYQQHDWVMTVIKVTPMLRNLHPDPRYKELLVRMKLDGSGPGLLH